MTAEGLGGLAVLVTGGTGSFGQAFVRRVLEGEPERVVVLSRDELKQSEMRAAIPDDRLTFLIGDVRDRDRVYQAMRGMDAVVHAAALKQVPSGERNPLEVVKTNVLGAANVIDAAIDRGVVRLIALSTDKACNPVNLYGSTKLCADKLVLATHSRLNGRGPRMAVVRYGNVMGSRGSVIPIFRRLAERGEPLKITDPAMTRFWLRLEDGVSFVLRALGLMKGGETFVPKLPTAGVLDIARAIAGPDASFTTIGTRPGEKLHEVLVPEGSGRSTMEFRGMYVTLPDEGWAGYRLGDEPGTWCAPDFTYRSDTNPWRLTVAETKELIDGHEA